MTGSGRYILDEKGRPVPEPDLLKWAMWFETANRSVGDETIGGVRISTIFLALDHGWGGGPPVLWETMTFGPDPFHQERDRCSGSWEQAEAMHADVVERVRAVLALVD